MSGYMLPSGQAWDLSRFFCDQVGRVPVPLTVVHPPYPDDRGLGKRLPCDCGGTGWVTTKGKGWTGGGTCNSCHGYGTRRVEVPFDWSTASPRERLYANLMLRLIGGEPV